MAMVECPECGHAVSTTATACPNCGYVMNATREPAAHEHADHTHAGHVHTGPHAGHLHTHGHTHARRRVGAGRYLAGIFFLALLVLLALWYFDVVNFV